ncbi:MAG: SPASM domain-containing protein [Erysipelotrichaceae bacterium]|nr:SPASM domain-containing protein [Erysipelotrichaceae bacterium]
MRYFSTLIKPAGALCNMNCCYCFYRELAQQINKPNLIMSLDTTEHLIQNILFNLTELTTVTFAFQGGEPTLAGIDYFKHFVDTVNIYKKDHHIIQYSIQTNGYTLNEEWFNFLKEYQFLVGVSLDGFPRIHNQLRKNSLKQDTYEIIIKNIRELKKRNIEFNILTVLTNQLAKYPKEMFEFILKNEFKNIQFIPCLPELDQMKSAYSIQPKEFFQFYDVLFPMWFKEFKRGNVISISFFDQFVSAFAGIRPQGCGTLGNCTNQFVIESDGSIYPCDFYVLEKNKLGNIHETDIKAAAYGEVARQFLAEPKNMSALCSTCRYQPLCKGQCKRQSICFYTDHYCAIQKFLSKYEKEFLQIALRIKKR